MNPTITMPITVRRSSRILACLAAGALTLGCADRPPTGVYGETTTLLQRVRSDFKALNMSPGDSRTLAPKAYSAGGSLLTDSVSLRYSSSSANRVSVDADGTVHALVLTEEPVSIIVAGTQGQITQFDTVFVNVIAAPPAPATKLAMFFDGDSLGLGAGGSNELHGVLLTASGDTLQDLLVVFTSKDDRITTPSRYQTRTWMQGITPGQTWVYGTAALGSSTFVDSLQVHVGWAAEAYMSWTYLGRWGDAGTNLVLQPNGIVYFNNWNDQMSQDIVFDDPTVAEAVNPGDPSGNIPAFKFATNPRRFSKPGTYTWRSKDAKGNAQVGQITVKLNPSF